MHCTLPRSPSRSASDAITCRLSPRIHAVGPVGVVAVELGLGLLGGQPVEVGEQIGEAVLHALDLRPPRLLALPHQVVDQCLGMDAFLDVEGRRVDDQLRPVLLVLAAQDQLRVQVAVAPGVGNLDGTLLRVLHQRLVLGAGQILAAGIAVGEGFDRFGLFSSRHVEILKRT